MDDKDFYAHIYQIWSKTTGAKDMFWMPEENLEDKAHLGREVFDLYAVRVEEDGTEERKLLASYLSDEDADFISAVHGCFGDLYRKMLSLTDEADRLDEERDRQEKRIFNLELQVDDLRGLLEKAQ